MTRALVLGGGGVAGIAWETGLLLGLLESGVDVTDADVVIGTSAGSAVAAQITTGSSLPDLYQRQVSGEAAKHEIHAEFDAESMMATFGKIVAKLVPGVVMNRAIGEYALHASTVPEARRRAVIAGRLPVHEWPERELVITSVDARAGKPRNFRRDDGVDLVDAVAASCAVPGIWPPVTIQGRRYIDGGMRSTSNADLAAGYDDILVISPMPELPMVAASVKRAIEHLSEGSCVVTIQADADSLAAMGSNPLDPATAKPAAEAGRAQAAAHATEVMALWKGDAGG
ncbi:MAG: patatin-like phospholipase family protein [Frankiaceae bacterium]|nr:patatin-like phospholipase family protein [Frankiaceae bacterium]MBV9869433.1 patatin-like phospholipase family protein [Frankiaceae bacterium]